VLENIENIEELIHKIQSLLFGYVVFYLLTGIWTSSNVQLGDAEPIGRRT
jgi:hypothetical protein